MARQKLIAAEAAKAAPTKAASTVQKPSIAAPASNALSPPPTIAPPAPPAAPSAAAAAGGSSSGGGNTTISLTGNGTDYSKVDGPIDPNFKSKRQVTGAFQGIKVWGPIDPPGQIGIWGTE
ncbi:MAG: hypothetical protein WBL88_14250, partial [Nitrososphaeraceae archaeon]